MTLFKNRSVSWMRISPDKSNPQPATEVGLDPARRATASGALGRGLGKIPVHFPHPSPGCMLAKELIVFGMASYPKPKQTFCDFNCKRAIVKTHPDRPVLANLLEVQ
jgi:hypothetical protein